MKFYSPSKYFREVFTNNRETYETVGSTGTGDDSSSVLSASRQLMYSSNTVSIREGDELLVTCTVNSSKPAAVLSLWVLKRPVASVNGRRKKRRVGGSDDVATNSIIGGGDSIPPPSNEDSDSDSDARRLDIIDSYVTKNADLTLKSVSTSKFVVSRVDNHRLVACNAENSMLNEKWETKRILNVLCK